MSVSTVFQQQWKDQLVCGTVSALSSLFSQMVSDWNPNIPQSPSRLKLPAEVLL